MKLCFPKHVHRSNTIVYFNNLVANVLHGNIGSKKSAFILRSMPLFLLDDLLSRYLVQSNLVIRNGLIRNKLVLRNQLPIYFIRIRNIWR